ncbi:MAG: hypothetical protein MNPFHGCM_01209 [Gemmatimonadaceae bacterium]|nr:hypothetical protein [Gemmatimonadaceae bacterium]
MSNFAVFGGVLRSHIDFPELAQMGDVEPTWSLEAGVNPPSLGDAASLGVDTVYASCSVRAFKREAGGYSLVFDDTGRFDISADGRRITWFGGTDRLLDAGRADILGRVLPLALHGSGILSLHASAVAMGNEGVAFLAPKYHGKSTLATAMVEAGARLITDDVLPVLISEPPICLPGVPRLRLWRDSVQAMRGSATAQQVPDERKHLVDDLRPEQVQSLPVRFSTAYILTPMNELPDHAAVLREPIDSIAATLSLVQHAKLAPLLAGGEAGALFSQTASVAGAIRVYDLYVTRDFTRLDEVARAIARWHLLPSPAVFTS